MSITEHYLWTHLALIISILLFGLITFISFEIIEIMSRKRIGKMIKYAKLQKSVEDKK